MTTSATYVDMKVDIAERYRAYIASPDAEKIYFTFGKTDAWPDDTNPNAASATVSTMYNVWDNMIGGKIITAADISLAIPRYNWTSGNTYFAFDDINSQSNGDNVQFYVMTTDYNVYKCIANNYGAASTVMPTAINPSATTTTADGYIWKYMYTVSDNDKLRFLTDSYIPIKTLYGDDGSVQWAVQQAAVPGSINSIIVTSGGSNYNSAPTVTITGDGISATAIANINAISNTVSSITVTSVGQNYSFANVAITGGGGAGATARAIMSPLEGHGADPLYELGGKTLMFDLRLQGSESGTLPVSNDYRQISILHEPLIANSEDQFMNTTFVQTYTLCTNPAASGDYLPDEIVYIGTTLANATYSGRVVTWDSANGIATTINNRGSVGVGTLVGATSSVSRQLLTFSKGQLEPFSAKVSYVDHIKPIIRSPDQTEDFKIVVKF